MDFRFEDIKQFIVNWYSTPRDIHASVKSFDLIQRLEQNPRIQTLAANPLLLTLITLVYEAQLDLPDKRAVLYKECIDTLLTKWDAKRNVRRRREFKPEHKHQLLKAIAWHFHIKGQRFFPERELLEVIAIFLPAIGLPQDQNSPILQEIESEQGLLKEMAQDWHGFLHLTLQEYFVAEYIIDHDQLKILLSCRANPWWEEVLQLYAGSASDVSPLLQKLLALDKKDNVREDIFHTNILLAGQCLAARPTILQFDLRAIVISRLFDILMETTYSLMQQSAADTLSKIGGREILVNLLQIISNRKLNKKLRRNVVFALGKSREHSIATESGTLIIRPTSR